MLGLLQRKSKIAELPPCTEITEPIRQTCLKYIGDVLKCEPVFANNFKDDLFVAVTMLAPQDVERFAAQSMQKNLCVYARPAIYVLGAFPINRLYPEPVALAVYECLCQAIEELTGKPWVNTYLHYVDSMGKMQEQFGMTPWDALAHHYVYDLEQAGFIGAGGCASMQAAVGLTLVSKAIVRAQNTMFTLYGCDKSVWKQRKAQILASTGYPPDASGQQG